MVLEPIRTATASRFPSSKPPIRQEPGEFMIERIERALPSSIRTRIPEGAEKLGAKSLALGYGITFGAAYALVRRKPGNILVEGTALGLATWAAGYLGWLPATKLMPPVTQQKPQQIAAPIAQHIVFGIVAVALASLVACGGNSQSNRGDTASGTVASAADTTPTVRGTVASLSNNSLVVASDKGNVTVKLNTPVEVYDRQPATLADVKDNTFIGVTTVKQPDGTEQATEIHIFPDALRGLGEGSRMMTATAGSGSSASRMTNGAVSGSRMTNGTATPSRMSNGNVSGVNGSTFVVQYSGGSQKVVVPPNTPVTEIKATSTPLAQGDRVVVLAKRDADGSLTANRVLLSQK